MRTFTGRLWLLSRTQYRNLLVCSEAYRQQKLMYDSRTRSICGRIVSVSQPHVRPIIRGKAATPVEFGAKISLSKVEQFVYLNRVSWDPYHESEELPEVWCGRSVSPSTRLLPPERTCGCDLPHKSKQAVLQRARHTVKRPTARPAEEAAE